MRVQIAIIAATIVLVSGAVSDAQAPKPKPPRPRPLAGGGQQYGQSICTAATTGSPPTSTVVQRAPSGTQTWTTISPVLPMTGTPAVSAPFVDTTRVAGVSYQYRCLESNAAGSTPTDPSASFTFVDVTTPDKGVIGVTIITQ